MSEIVSAVERFTKKRCLTQNAEDQRSLYGTVRHLIINSHVKRSRKPR